MTEDRLRGIEEAWRLSTDGSGSACYVTPAAHVAREQVLELVAEVRRLQAAHYELMFGMM